MPDQIHIEQLELQAHIGVPDEERAQPQRLTISITLQPKRDFRMLEDSLANTIDYFDVCRTVQAHAVDHPRSLIETLAEEIATLITRKYPVAAVHIELRKYILPETAFVSVRLSRTA